ncbi:MAG: PQQ-binding-like beta-propeller repeat protein, partial [Terriglobia bacterium]
TRQSTLIPLNVSDVRRLKLTWAFGFPGAYATFGQPTVYRERVFAGSEDGTVYSLDAKTGCIYWTYKAPSTVKTAVSIGLKGRDAFFGDVSGNVYVANALTAALIWKVHVDPHPAARITGSPLLWHGRLYVPVSSGEEGAAIDRAHRGRVVWGSRIGKGGPLGGIEWGGATAGRSVVFPLSDWQDGNPNAGGGLFALQIATGKQVWYAPPAKPDCASQVGCSAAQMAPVTAVPGVVFSGSEDGHVRAYAARNGKLLWDFDTARDFQVVNGVKARGGSLNATGPAIVGGMLYLDAGYTNGLAGNVLLAFAVDGK